MNVTVECCVLGDIGSRNNIVEVIDSNAAVDSDEATNSRVVVDRGSIEMSMANCCTVVDSDTTIDRDDIDSWNSSNDGNITWYYTDRAVKVAVVDNRVVTSDKSSIDVSMSVNSYIGTETS